MTRSLWCDDVLMRLVSPSQIETAGALLAGVVRTTPLTPVRVLGEHVFVKCENVQRTGSFKFRGAYTRLCGLDREQRAAGVVAASAGNHAQGVALAAALLDIPCTVFMPEQASLPKLAATRGYGADVRSLGANIEEALGAAQQYAAETGAVFVHPFDHPDIIAGQGTVGLEILNAAPDVRTVVVPLGGGGLLSGIAALLRARRPEVRIVGVQAQGAAAWPPSLAAGMPLRLEDAQTVADGIAVGEPGQLTFAHVSELVDDVLTVSDEALSRALLVSLERAKLVVEAAGIAALAAVQEHPEQFRGTTVPVLSGGNIDPLLLLQLIRHGMSSAGRFLSLAVRLADHPGSLAELLALLGRLSANVLDIEHSRISGALEIGEVDVEVSLETRGPEHSDSVVTALRTEGFVVTAKR